MKRLSLILGIVISIGTVIGATFFVDARFAKQATMIQRDVALSTDIASLANRVDQQIKQDRAKALQEQMWALERYYGIKKAQHMGEYKRLKSEREAILRGLK